MEYIFSKVFKRIIINIKSNLLIALQISIGIVLFIILANVSYYIRKMYYDYINNNANYNYVITAMSKKETNDAVFNQQQYIALSHITEMNFCIEIDSDIISFAGLSHFEDNEEVIDKYVIKYSSNYSQINAEIEFLDMLRLADKNNTVNYNDIFFSVANNKIIFPDKNMADITLFTDNDDHVHTIILPLKYYFLYGNSCKNCKLNINIEIMNKNSTQCNKKLYEIKHNLESLNCDYNYIIESGFFDFLQKSASDKEQAALWGIILFVLTLIVFLGVFSLFMMLIEKRTFELSVCLALGAKVKLLLVELILELFIISVVPTVLAILLTYICLNRGFTFINVFIPYLNPFIDIWALLMILLADIICLIPICLRICKLKPQELLREY